LRLHPEVHATLKVRVESTTPLPQPAEAPEIRPGEKGGPVRTESVAAVPSALKGVPLAKAKLKTRPKASPGRLPKAGQNRCEKAASAKSGKAKVSSSASRFEQAGLNGPACFFVELRSGKL
jgi:hypothetical protein